MSAYNSWLKFGPVLSSEALSDHSSAELVDLIRSGLKKKIEQVADINTQLCIISDFTAI